MTVQVLPNGLSVAICMLIATRTGTMVGEELIQCFTSHLESVQSKADAEAFCLHFQLSRSKGLTKEQRSFMKEQMNLLKQAHGYDTLVS